MKSANLKYKYYTRIYNSVISDEVRAYVCNGIPEFPILVTPILFVLYPKIKK